MERRERRRGANRKLAHALLDQARAAGALTLRISLRKPMQLPGVCTGMPKEVFSGPGLPLPEMTNL